MDQGQAHPPRWALGWVKAFQELLLVDFAHLVAWDLLHHDQLCRDGVGSHDVPGTANCSCQSWAGPAEPSWEHSQPRAAPPGTPTHIPGAHLSSAPLQMCVGVFVPSSAGSGSFLGIPQLGSVIPPEGRGSTSGVRNPLCLWCQSLRGPQVSPLPGVCDGSPEPCPLRSRGGLCCPCVTELRCVCPCVPGPGTDSNAGCRGCPAPGAPGTLPPPPPAPRHMEPLTRDGACRREAPGKAKAAK